MSAIEPLPLTLCVSTRNAGRDLAGCLDSVAGWVAEIVIIDMESSDDTIAIAQARGASVVRVPAAGWAEPGRQAGLDAATQPWVLVLDADERAAAGLRDAVAGYVVRDDLSGVWLPRQNFQFGWWVADAGIWPDWQLRLLRRADSHWPGDRTHIGAQVTGRCEHAPARVDNAIVHHSYRSVGEWVSAMNRYTDLEADRYEVAGRRPGLGRLLALPAARFVDLYVRQRGWRGGRYGLAVALMSWCYWLVAELKLWQRRLSPSAPPRGGVAEPRAEAAVSDGATGRPSSSPPDAR